MKVAKSIFISVKKANIQNWPLLFNPYYYYENVQKSNRKYKRFYLKSCLSTDKFLNYYKNIVSNKDNLYKSNNNNDYNHKKLFSYNNSQILKIKNNYINLNNKCDNNKLIKYPQNSQKQISGKPLI